jgi:cation diffusion facilitator family transporter
MARLSSASLERVRVIVADPIDARSRTWPLAGVLRPRPLTKQKERSAKVATGSRKVVYASLVADTGVAIAKLAVGLLTGSAAVLAEAAHSAADTINQILLLTGLNLSDTPADATHPYGYGKDRFFWSFLAAVFIFVAGAVFSIYQGIHKLFEPHGDPGAFWPAYLVLGVALLFDGGVLVISTREARTRAEYFDLGTFEYIRKTSDVTLKTAFYEDAAAVTGLVIAAGGLLLYQTTHNPLWDGLASILIGVVLVVVALSLGAQTRRLLLGAAAPERVQAAIRGAIASFPEVHAVVRLLTMQLGLNSFLVTGELNIRDNLTTDEIEDLLNRITRRIREVAPGAQNVYLEPNAVPTGPLTTTTREERERLRNGETPLPPYEEDVLVAESHEQPAS